MMETNIHLADKQVRRAFSQEYSMIRKLGKGGMGSVYLVRSMGKRPSLYALKILKKKDYDHPSDLYREIRIILKMVHPGIPHIISVREDADRLYILQDYIDGIDFQSIFLRIGAVPERYLLIWMKELSAIFEYIHSKGIIHRDVKPGNIMLERSGRIKLIDFGLAKGFRKRDRADHLVKGTGPYIAPERYIRRSVNEQTDIYGFGAAMYQMATGKVPLVMTDDPEKNAMKMMRILRKSVSKDLGQIIEKSMAPHPQDRYYHFNEIAEDLEKIVIQSNDKTDRIQKAKKYVVSGISLILTGISIIFAGLLML